MGTDILLETASDPRIIGKLLDSFFGGEPLSASLIFVGSGIMLVFLIQFVNDIIALFIKKDPSPILKRLVTTVMTVIVSVLTVLYINVDFSVSQMMFWSGTIASILYRLYISGVFDRLGLDTCTVATKLQSQEIA